MLRLSAAGGGAHLKLNPVVGQFFGPWQRTGSLKHERGLGVQRDAWTRRPEVQASTQSGRFVALPNPSLALQASMNRQYLPWRKQFFLSDPAWLGTLLGWKP